MMVKSDRLWRIAIALVALPLLFTACEHTEAPIDPVFVEPVCPGQRTPENVMNRLVVSYEWREIEAYAPLLHPEFIFRFQDGDEPPELGRDFWTHDEDSSATAALFNSPQVADITLELTYGVAEPAEDLGMEGTMRIRVTSMRLTVEMVDGTTYLVEGDIQDIFFTRGTGAHSICWYIVEWRDIPGPSSGLPEGGVRVGASEKISWGRLKALFR